LGTSDGNFRVPGADLDVPKTAILLDLGGFGGSSEVHEGTFGGKLPLLDSGCGMGQMRIDIRRERGADLLEAKQNPAWDAIKACLTVAFVCSDAFPVTSEVGGVLLRAGCRVAPS
jgi:hypothetical protein